MTLTRDELGFYGRQMLLPQVGTEGQLRLKRASVLLIGAGGLGSPLATYLAAAGVGRLGIVEDDRVDVSNLHRQFLYDFADAGALKGERAAARLRALNPHVEIVLHATRFAAGNARELVRGYDVVADGADNFPTRYLVNDACVLEKKPLVSASILGFEGQLSVFGFAGGPCYRCLYPEPPPAGTVPSCSESGVLGALPGVMGSLQACEILKIVLGAGTPASGKLLHFDALSASFAELKIHRSPQCAACGDSPTITTISEIVVACPTDDVPSISVETLARDLKAGAVLLLDVREEFERRLCKIDPSLHVPLQGLLDGEAPSPQGKRIAVLCKSGGRSLRAARALRGRGFDVVNVEGGMTAWAARIDPSKSER